MRVRTVITGCVAGVVCIIILNILYYRIETAKIVPGWPNLVQALLLPGWVPLTILIFCGLILIAAGWVAARWNWATTWQASLTAGAGTGLLAGCLIYDFIGVYWFGLIGQADVLKNYYNPVTEAEGTRIVVEALIKTGTALYTNFVWCMLACMALGALGGLASAIDLKDRWGTHPRNPEGWMFRLPTYLLVFLGFINLIITIAVMETLGDKMLNTVLQMREKYGLELEHSFNKADFLRFMYLSGWIFTLLPAGIIVGWFIRLHRQGGRLNLSSITGLVFMFILIVGFLWFLSPDIFSLQGNHPFPILVAILLSALLATWVGFMTKDESEGFPYHSSDWIGYLVGYGILGGTQILMGAPAFALPIALINIVNIRHLVTGGIVEQNPVSQVNTLFGVLTGAAFASMLVSALIALIVVNLVSFFRGVFDIRETHPPRQSYERD